MGHCNLKPTDDCYGCGYWGSGDMDGCELTIAFHRKYPNGTDEEYERYMIEQGRINPKQ
jgi:hypothetical protein